MSVGVLNVKIFSFLLMPYIHWTRKLKLDAKHFYDTFMDTLLSIFRGYIIWSLKMCKTMVKNEF